MLHLHPDTFVKPLQSGDEVITVAVSSALNNDLALLDGLKVLESWGLVCRPQAVSKRYWGYLAGIDSVRYHELHPKEPAPLLAFARGGWGAARLLERPQPWQPGWLLGFSDVTSLLLSRLSAGFDGGIHGPLLTSLASEPLWSKERLRSLLFENTVPDLYGESWNKGIATGPLVVANLTVASHLLGSRHMPDLKGSILVLEDVGELPYRIDRMLTQWRLTGQLQGLAGLAFGNFSECEAPEGEPFNETFQLQEVLKERSQDLEIPIINNLPVGHCCGNAALPQGRLATIDGGKGLLKILPS
ncbi:LD-carboxypeptidase [Prochlorococcus sp. MIT 1307]|uniref:S66 peptidase family protein n=1 Tax=Prochlorococcus sp. MIT 1307 TaxID=3096219 RepID=UPI002A753492|nr:LD-carboxypeptidase [Prochlorococcus sp. MIT 1307]